MSGILRRTVYYEFDQRHNQGSGIYRFCDWNTVVTGLGHMMEPSQLVPRPVAGGQLDWEDDMAKIDIMENLNADKPHVLSGGGDAVIGHNVMPRKGR